MHSAIAAGKMWGSSRKRIARAVLTIVVLSAVAAVALTLPGREVFAYWSNPQSAEKAVASGDTPQGFLTLATPTSTLMRFRAEVKDARRSKDLAGDAPLLVKNWKYTGLQDPPQFQTSPNSLAELISESWSLFLLTTAFEAFEESFNAYTAQITQVAATILPPQLASLVTLRLQAIDSLVDQVINAYVSAASTWQAFLNQSIPPPLRPPAVPPVSPSS